MSIAFDRGNTVAADSHTIQRSQFIHGVSCNRSPTPRVIAGDGIIPMAKVKKQGGDTDSCSSSSSIGRNSDLSSVSSVDGEDDSGGIEVQSDYKGPLDSMDVLEDVLPIRRGISKHYSGKSKSFTSLSEAISFSSIKELAKPLNSYTKKRKNELGHGNKYQNHSQNPNPNQNQPSRINSGGGILKRMTNVNKITISSDSSSPQRLPPLHPPSKLSTTNESPSSSPPQQNNLTWRSFSLSDLQSFTPDTPCFPGVVIDNRLQ